MSLKKTLATAATAAILGTGLATVPTAMASPESPVVQSAQAATLGWGSKCATYYTRTIVNTNWVAVYRIDKYWFTSSLTGTKCIDRYKTFVRYESR